jgi:hypothetical protein
LLPNAAWDSPAGSRALRVELTALLPLPSQRDAKVLLTSLGRFFQASNVVDRALHFYLIAAQDRPTSERQTVILATAAFALGMKERSRAETLRQFCVRDGRPLSCIQSAPTLTCFRSCRS